MLDIKKIIENAIANTLADDVGDILESRFRNMLSEARPVTDLIADYTEATFVQWNADTENTPYKAGITECSEGFALVYGTVSGNLTIIAWTIGSESADCFTCTVTNGVVNEWEGYLDKWEKCLLKSGGTMTGPLGLGDGKGKVSADSDEAFLESTEDSNNYRRIKVANPSSIPISESVKLNTLEDGVENNFTLYGTHNLPNATQIKYGTYTGDGKCGPSYPNTLEADFDIKIVIVYYNYTYTQVHHSPMRRSDMIMFCKNEECGELRVDWSVPNHVSYYHLMDEAYENRSNAKSQYNELGVTYH